MIQIFFSIIINLSLENIVYLCINCGLLLVLVNHKYYFLLILYFV